MAPGRILLHVPSAEDMILLVVAPMPPTGDAGEMNDIIGSNILRDDDQALLAASLAAVKDNPTNRAYAPLESMKDGTDSMVILPIEGMLIKVTPTTALQRFVSV